MSTTETREKFLKRQAVELAEFEKKESIRALLPEAYRDGAIISIHQSHASVKVWNDFRTGKKLSDAIEFLGLFESQIQTCEHWRYGCVSTQPPQLNEYAKKEGAEMDGGHVVEILVNGGKGFGPCVELRFWVETSAGMIEFECAVSDLWKLTPRVEATYNQHGDVCRCSITWPVESRCVDSFRNWSSEKPAYRGSYYLADLPNFYSWAGAINAPKAESEAA